ncbi:CrcB family protein [Nocardioides solisilvae]|uniref:CrcB family protein n=1 Tax=Nocardioides solisilvae TaxID=1542435 RepID=UPI000D74D325|nr:CrcB family protein [Nocardioides solisilvae]
MRPTARRTGRRPHASADAPARETTLLAVVVVGGALGGLLRWALGEALEGRLPVAVGGVDPGLLAVNVGGAFLLGLLPGLLHRLEASGRVGRGRRAVLGALAGPGLLGGFTTLSAVALLTVGPLRDDRVVVAVAQLLGTLVAAVAAVALARRLLPVEPAP